MAFTFPVQKYLPKHGGFLHYKAIGSFNSCILLKWLKYHDICKPTGWEKLWHDNVIILATRGSMLARFVIIIHGYDEPLTGCVL